MPRCASPAPRASRLGLLSGASRPCRWSRAYLAFPRRDELGVHSTGLAKVARHRVVSQPQGPAFGKIELKHAVAARLQLQALREVIGAFCVLGQHLAFQGAAPIYWVRQLSFPLCSKCRLSGPALFF